MTAAFVLITGVLLIVLIGTVAFVWMGMGNILKSLLPLAPWLLMVGTVLLILTELLLFLGGKEDRKAAKKDLGYLIPTCLVSGVVWWIAQKFMW